MQPRTTPAPEAAAPGGASPGDSGLGAYPWYVVVLLFLVYFSNHIDRQILAILLEPIKQEFGAFFTPRFGELAIPSATPCSSPCRAT